MLNFINSFTLLIGDLVSDCEEWTLILLLKEIINITFNVQFFEKDVDHFLSSLITEHNQIYMQLNQTLKPKFHNLIHYSRIIRNVDPLTQISSMRFESVHKIFKATLYSCNSRINLLKTIFAKYQLRFANFLMNYDEIFSEKIIAGATHQCNIDIFVSKYGLNNCKHAVTILNYFEVTYKKGVVIFIGAEEDLIPSFALIEHIIFDGNVYCLCLKDIYNHGLDPHYQSFILLKKKSYSLIFQLKKYTPKTNQFPI